MSAAPQTQPVLEAVDLTLDYSDATRTVRAVDGVSLSVGAGEFVGLVGPSGSGKSSLLFLLAGLRRPQTGHVAVCGERLPVEPDRAAPVRRSRIGFLFQEPFLVPYLTVLENALVHSFESGAAQRVAALADEIGMGPLLEERPHRLSGGERQRAGILRALANAPSLVLADEPTASLDQETGHAVMGVLRRRPEGAALVVVTHDPAMLDGADRVFAIRDGRLNPA